LANRDERERAVGEQFWAPCRRSHALLRGSDMRVRTWFRHVCREGVVRMAVGARLAIFSVMLVTPATAYGDLTAAYDGMLTIPKAGEDAIAARGLMQAGASLTGTVAVNAVTEGVSGIYTVSGTVKKTR